MKLLRILPLALSLVFIACDKDDATESLDTGGETTSESTVVAAVSLENVASEAEEVLDDIAIYSGRFFGIRGPGLSRDRDDRRGRSGFFRNCADIEVEETDNVMTVTIVFNGECEDDEGNAITGQIVRVETTTDTGSDNTITVTDLSINGSVINGTKEFSWTDSNANGNPEMSGSVDISIETADGTITKTGNRTVEITAGGDTDTHSDDEKTITGSFEYTGIENSNSMNITTPLVKPANCRYISSGVKTYTTAEGTSTLDFGDGTCDNVASLTTPDGTVEEIELCSRRDRNHRDDDEDDEDDEDEEDEEDDEDDEDEEDEDEEDEDEEDEDEEDEEDEEDDEEEGDDTDEDDDETDNGGN